MRRYLAIAFFIGLTCSGLPAKSLPLTVKDVALMLRSGYSNESVLRELELRRFGGDCDEAAEKLLVQAGAQRELLDALKNKTFAASSDAAARATALAAEQTARHAAAAEHDRKFNTLYQSNLAKARAAAPAIAAVSAPNAMAPLLKGDLVVWRNARLEHFDDAPLENKTLIALYFSAHWCGPCQKFTPQLVEFYNRVAVQHPEFELIYVSQDHSAAEMQTYMREVKMPWPAIDYAKVAGKAGINKYYGDGIPCLVLVDLTGKVISDSFAGKKYLGPEKVLADLNSIFAAKTTASR
ncbi:MAG: nucleoredoxin [Verrucomicrobiota bacterium]|jgi:nucleoredoxin